MAKAVQDLMLPEPLTVDAQLTLQEAARLMRRWDVEDILVVEGDRFRGMLTLSNIVVTAIASGHHPAVLTVGECCEPAPHTVGPQDPASHAARIMAAHGLPRLPVLDDERLVGAIWATNLAACTPPA